MDELERNRARLNWQTQTRGPLMTSRRKEQGVGGRGSPMLRIALLAAIAWSLSMTALINAFAIIVH